MALMIMVFGVAAGFKRGLVLELTDWAIFFLAGFMGFRGFRPFGAFVHRMIKGWPLETCENLSLAFLLLFFGVMILSLGLHLDRAAREQERIPKQIREYGGSFFAFWKCLLISGLLVAYLPYSDGLATNEKRALRESTAAQSLKGLRGAIGALVTVITPPDIAQKFYESTK